MKKNIYILLASLLLACTSCSRKVVLHKSHTKTTKDSSHLAIDTSKTITINTTKEIKKFGDTLKAAFILPFKIAKDSGGLKSFPIQVESNGIKIKGAITQREDGLGFDLLLDAIAKELASIKESQTTINNQKGISAATNTNTNTNTNEFDKQTDKQNNFFKWIFLSLIPLGVILLGGFAIWLYFNYRLKSIKNG